MCHFNICGSRFLAGTPVVLGDLTVQDLTDVKVNTTTIRNADATVIDILRCE